MWSRLSPTGRGLCPLASGAVGSGVCLRTGSNMGEQVRCGHRRPWSHVHLVHLDELLFSYANKQNPSCAPPGKAEVLQEETRFLRRVRDSGVGSLPRGLASRLREGGTGHSPDAVYLSCVNRVPCLAALRPSAGFKAPCMGTDAVCSRRVSRPWTKEPH